MNAEQNSDRAALDRLTDELVEEVLTVPDADVLADFWEDYGDPAAFADLMRARVEQMRTAPPMEDDTDGPAPTA
jgi:hypothetical protein